MLFVCIAKRSPVIVMAALLAVASASCNSGPRPIGQPSINASSAGSQAMETYDKDGDGIVTGAELDQGTGAEVGDGDVDTNGDKGVGASEVADRVNAWNAMKTGLTKCARRVTLDGQPLDGADNTRARSISWGRSEYGSREDERMATWCQASRLTRGPRRHLPGGVQFGLYKVADQKDRERQRNDSCELQHGYHARARSVV